ncbi:auxin response factor 8-like [Hordeum vulgare]|nr:auxin response factor 8-like [Hordeum vulgare]
MQSDANKGGGFSVPRFCTETIFPALDYSSEPPVQSIVVRYVHGDEFKFRHIYRGTPLRHLLTTGWSNFVNQKKLLAGDSIVFLRCQMSNHHLPALSNYRVQSVVKEKDRTCSGAATPKDRTSTPPLSSFNLFSDLLFFPKLDPFSCVFLLEM